MSDSETMILAGAPDVPGLRFRHFRGAADFAGLSVASNASRLADGREFTTTEEGLANYYAHLANCDPATDMTVAEIDGTLVGFTRVEWYLEETGAYRYVFPLVLQPEWRGRGIRRAMLHWAEARARQIAAGHPADALKRLGSNVFSQAVSLAALLEDEGYRPVRYFSDMTRSLDTPLPDFAMPPGLEMRPVRPEHYRPIWEASEDAFRDHWGYSPASEEEYRAWLADEVVFTPELWQIAWDVATDEIAGQVRTFIDSPENERFQRQRGYTEFISVRRPYRRRGLARALIAESLRVQKARGMTESGLTVDSENLTGATRLYEACGFAVTSQATIYHKLLETQPSPAGDET